MSLPNPRILLSALVLTVSSVTPATAHPGHYHPPQEVDEFDDDVFVPAASRHSADEDPHGSSDTVPFLAILTATALLAAGIRRMNGGHRSASGGIQTSPGR